jgi:hypothetical protein
VIGTRLARRVGANHKRYCETRISHGAILMWVRTADKDKRRWRLRS